MFLRLLFQKVNFRHFGKKSFCKDSASREKKKELARFFLRRRRLSYGKIVQAERRKKSLLDFFCRVAACLMER